MRYLSRNKLYKKVDTEKTAKKIYIFCEGEETEVKYFQYFQGLSSNIDIIPIPNVNGQTDPVKLKENAELSFFGESPKLLLSEEYKDEVWFVIDTDRWNEGNKIEQLKEFCNTKSKSYKQWIIAQSNPCFELWFYYHFNDVLPEKCNVDYYPSFKGFVNSTIRGGFDRRKMPIEIESAITNSKANFRIENDQPSLYSTEVHNSGEI